ncbi:MAG: chalcone isomerase family protein [Brevinema sp.]
MKYITMCALMFSCIPTFSIEIKNIKIAETLSIQGKALVLNGAGLRKKSIIDLYVASMYTTSKKTDTSKIINDPKEIVLKLNILSSFVGAKQLNKAILEGFKANHTDEELQILRDEIQKLQNAFSKQKITTGTVIEFIFMDSKISIRQDDSEIVTFDNQAFKKGLLSIWIGNNAVDANLKKSLLSL